VGNELLPGDGFVSAAPASVDEYIGAQSPNRREALREIRRRIFEAVPDAVESIRYGMPAYRLPNGHPVYFAGWKQHVSLHDIPVFESDLEAEVAPFRSGKDTLKFPSSSAVPFDLVSRIMVAVANRSA
jgi:uncharacterized protein YdhG (YjbR/CyaY superfamily)